MSGRFAAILTVLFASAPAGLAGVAPAHAGVPIGSTSGSGAFGRWAVDDAGLPMYRYTLDQARAPFARQPELLGRTDAWHQIGNGRAIATASNDGHVQLWSQDRRYQWVNRYDPGARQLAGIEPTAHGYAIRPALPMREFSLRLPDVGLRWGPREASGYVRAVRGDRLRIVVRAPSGRRYRAVVAGGPARSRRRGADVVFSLRTRPGRLVRWALVPQASRRSGRRPAGTTTRTRLAMRPA